MKRDIHFLKFDQEMPFADYGFGTKRTAHDSREETTKLYADILGPIAQMHQVHGSNIVKATEAGWHANCDALYTDQPDFWLAVATADCAPVLVSSPKAVAAVHCGWRSTQMEILPKVIARLCNEYQQNPKDLWVSIGPCIQQHSYEVDDGFLNHFDKKFFIPSTSQKKIMFDLPGVVKEQAMKNGVLENHILNSGLCTLEEQDTLHSYRRATLEKESGYSVQLSLIRKK